MAKLVVILGFVVAFAAGLVVGSRADRSRQASAATTTTAGPTNPGPTEAGPRTPTTSPDRGGPDRGPGGWLAAELKLTPDQHRELDHIWSDVARRGRRRDHEGQRQAMRDERDVAVAALIAPDRWGAYERIMTDYAERSAALDREFRADFDQAVERTKQILTPDQRARYDKLLARQRWGPPGHGRHKDDRHQDDRGPDNRATSQPDDRTPR